MSRRICAVGDRVPRVQIVRDVAGEPFADFPRPVGGSVLGVPLLELCCSMVCPR